LAPFVVGDQGDGDHQDDQDGDQDFHGWFRIA
jgi:hypothetical protein